MKFDFSNKKVLVVGLARAGLSMARALKKVGAEVLVVDQKSADNSAMFEPMDILNSLDIPFISGWAGDVNWDEFDLITPSPGVPKNHPTLVDAAKKDIPIFSEIEVGYLLSKAPIIAITGTNGKSTVTALTHHVLQHSGVDSILCGNIAGSGYEERTICDASIVANESNVLVAEVSSFQLEWVQNFRPKCATITQITQDHLDRYKTFEEYSSFKFRIYENMDVGDTIVINKFRQETIPASTKADILSIGDFGSSAVISEGKLTFSDSDVVVEMNDLWVPGKHSLSNLATAVLLSQPFGVKTEKAVESVENFKGIQNRMEFIGESNNIKFINNSMCTNPSAVEASLDGFSGNVLLLAGGINKVVDLSPFSRTAPRIKSAFLFGRDASQISDALAVGGCKSQLFGTLEQAFAKSIQCSESGDVIVLSPGCSSFDQFQDFIERGNRFRELAKQVIGSS